jgi:hypothetical protein
MAGLPSLFNCDKCGLTIDPKSTMTLRFVSGWLKTQSRQMVLLETEHYIYRHDFCVLSAEKKDQDPLF